MISVGEETKKAVFENSKWWKIQCSYSVINNLMVFAELAMTPQKSEEHYEYIDLKLKLSVSPIRHRVLSSTCIKVSK